MKITDGWMCQFLRYTPDALPRVETLAEADGVIFTCPKCARDTRESDGKLTGHVVICWFKGKVPPSASPGPGRWTPSGTGLDDLTLSPSVELPGMDGCRWHGWVKDGDAK